MARRQLRGCRVHALLALLLLLLPSPVTSGTTCPTPTSIEYADIQVKSYQENSRERYVCNSGFKRKAGTSSLTKCVRNKTTNTANWTTPNLKCIRDPSLAQQRPVTPSTVVTTRVTPHRGQSPSPTGKEPAALSPTPDTIVATETALVPDSWLTPSQSPATRVGSHESSQAPAQTTAKTLELTASTSLETPGAYPHRSKTITVAISSVACVLVVICVVFLVWHLMSRFTSQSCGSEMEAMPMTSGTISREEDTGTYPHNS